jgi:hypothetical protein
MGKLTWTIVGCKQARSSWEALKQSQTKSQATHKGATCIDKKSHRSCTLWHELPHGILRQPRSAPQQPRGSTPTFHVRIGQDSILISHLQLTLALPLAPSTLLLLGLHTVEPPPPRPCTALNRGLLHGISVPDCVYPLDRCTATVQIPAQEAPGVCSCLVMMMVQDSCTRPGMLSWPSHRWKLQPRWQ